MRRILLTLLLGSGLCAQSLVLEPRQEQVPCGQTIQFRVPGRNPGELHWQTDRGRIDEQGLFTAPSEAGPCRISATEWQDVNHTVSTLVRAVEVSLRAPDQIWLHPREESRILIQLEFRGGEFNRKLIWRLGPSQLEGEPGSDRDAAGLGHPGDGQVDASGWVRAPSREGTYPVEITLADDPRIRAGVLLQVVKAKPGQVNAHGEPVRVQVQPAKVEIHSGEFQSFSAGVSGIDFQNVTWMIQGHPRDAEIDPDGVFHASAPGTYRIRANSFEYPECGGEAEVVVAPSVSGVLKPEDAPEEDLIGSTIVQAGPDAYLLLGGWNGKKASPRVMRLDLAAKSLHPCLQLQVPRVRCLAARLTDGTILVAGGIGMDGQGALRLAERLDPERKEAWKVGESHWTHLGGLLEALPNGRALLLGGTEADGKACGAEVFEAATATFKVLDDHPWPAHAASLALRSGQILILGGELHRKPVALLWRFEPGSNSFTPLGKLGQARSRCTATLLSDGVELVFLGGRGLKGTLASAERINLVTGRSNPGGHLTAPRERHAAVLIPTGQVLVFGGGEGSKASRILEDWNPDENACSVRDHLESGAWLPYLGLQPDGNTFIYGLAESAFGKVPLPPAWNALD